MNLADVFTFLFVILGFVIVFVSYWLMSAGLFPRFVERASGQFGRAPVRLLVLGTFTLVPLIFFGFGLSSKAPNPVMKVAALSLVVLPLLAALFGSAGLALRIGEGLKSSRDELEPWRRTLRGGSVLALSFVLPVFGWLALLAYAFVAGFGAFLACAFRRETASVPAHLHIQPSAIPAANEGPAVTTAV